MSYAHRIAKGTFIVFIFSLVGIALGYILRLFIARSISVEDFGLFYSILAFFSFIWVIKDFGLSSALVKYIPEFIERKKYSDIKYSIKFSFLFQFFIGLFIASITFIFSDYISIYFFHTMKASLIIKLFSIEVVIGIYFIKMVLQGFQKILAFSLIEVIRISAIFALLLVFSDMTLFNVAIGYFIASLVVQAIMIICVKRHLNSLKSSEGPSPDSRKKVFLFGSFIFIGSISTFLIGSADIMVLTYFRSLHEVGLYQAAISTSQLLLIFSNSVAIILFPIISEIWAKGKKDDISMYAGFMIKSIFFFMAFVSLVFIAFPEIIMSLLFGNKYIDSGLPLQILSFGMIFFSMNTIFSAVLNAIGQPKKNTKAVVIISVYNVAANIILVPLIGIEGAAISALSSYILGFIIFYRYVNASIKITIPIKSVYFILLNSAVSILIIYSVKHIISVNIFLEIVISVLIALSFYLGVFLKIKIFTKTDMDIIKDSKLFPARIIRLAERFFQ